MARIFAIGKVIYSTLCDAMPALTVTVKVHDWTDWTIDSCSQLIP